MAELGNTVVKGSLRALNGIYGDLTGSATQLKQTVLADTSTVKYYLAGSSASSGIGNLGNNASVYLNGNKLYATYFYGNGANLTNITGANVSGTIPVASVPTAIPWDRLLNNDSGSYVHLDTDGTNRTFVVNANLQVTGTVTQTQEKNLAISDKTIELFRRDSIATALSQLSGMFVQAYEGSSNAATAKAMFVGMAPQSVMVVKNTAYTDSDSTKRYAFARPVFMNDATYSSDAESVVYAAANIHEILSDLNLVAGGNYTSETITFSSANADIEPLSSYGYSYYQVRKSPAGMLYVGPISWTKNVQQEKMIVTTSPSGVANSTSATANAATYLNLTDGTNGSAATVKTSVKFTGTGATTISGSGASTAGGQTYININSTDQRVAVYSYSVNDTGEMIYLTGTTTAPASLASSYSGIGITEKETPTYFSGNKLFSTGYAHPAGTSMLLGNIDNSGKVKFIEDMWVGNTGENRWVFDTGSLYIHNRDIYNEQYPEIIDLTA